MGYHGVQIKCACGWENFDVRTHCRNCGIEVPERHVTLASVETAAHDIASEVAARQIKAAAETYCLGLLVEEQSEAGASVGKALRFGLDTPHSADLPETARDHLVHELGDLLAAVEFACLHGLFDRAGIEAARDRKLGKLCDPANRDNRGRPLAPRPIALGAAPKPLAGQKLIRTEGRKGAPVTLVFDDFGETFSLSLDEDDLAMVLGAAGESYPVFQPDTPPPRATLTTSKQADSLATLTFSRDGEAFDLCLDWEGSRAVRRALQDAFPDFPAAR